MSISVAVVGATGRMGKLTLDLIEASQDLELFAALDSKSDITQTIGADVVIDLTRFDVSQSVVEHAVANNQKLVVGTSGWSATHLQQLEKKLQSSEAVVVVVPNFSIGSMLATKFATEAAKFFDSIEIVEAHHAGKGRLSIWHGGAHRRTYRWRSRRQANSSTWCRSAGPR
jgi:4-hydroxy-tetrahydrodipicolinate reductase